MPPRYAYWTILIDSLPTAFRAREQAELIPTFQQLKRANPRIEMKWFADGRVWDSPDQAAHARERKRRGRDRPRQTRASRPARRSNERRRR